MRLYNLTTTDKDGNPGVFTRERATEQSKDTLTRFFAKYGDTVHAEYVGSESDKPVWRHATEEDLASGSGRIVLNT